MANHISRLTVVTLGVSDLAASRTFYEAVFGCHPNAEHEGIVFFELPGAWITLFPLADLAADIGPQVPATRPAFSGITLAYNARSREEVVAVFTAVAACGARIVKPPTETFWGGFSGYFADPDGFYWEVVWGPMFEFTADGELRFRR
jgi:uncharacterized protein